MSAGFVRLLSASDAVASPVRRARGVRRIEIVKETVMKHWTWVLGLVAAAGVATAMAQPPGGPGGGGPGGGGPGGGGPGGGRPPSPVIEALDADHDGAISADELKNAAEALSKLDKNKDGKLTEEEFRPQGGRPDQGGPGGGRPGGAGQGGGSAGGRGQGGAGSAGGRGPGGGGQNSGGQGGSGRGQGGGQGGPGGGAQRGPGGQGGPPQGPDPARMLEHAFEFDADKDGKLSKDELQKFIDDFMKHIPGPGGPGGEGGPGGGGPRGGAGDSQNGPGGGRPGQGGERPERPRRPE